MIWLIPPDHALLDTPRAVLDVRRKQKRIFRSIAQSVLCWYTELQDGTFQSDRGPIFDVRILDFKMDVEAVMAQFASNEIQAILLIHRDGLSYPQATRAAGLPTDRPDLVIEDIEVNLGQALYRRRLGDFLEYVEYFR